MSIIYWVNQGRLGNLLFQYVALRHHTRPADTIVCFDDELFRLVEAEERFIRLPIWPVLGKRINYEANKMARRFAAWGIVGSTTATTLPGTGSVVENGEVVIRDGRISRCAVFDGYFQKDEWALPPPRIRSGVSAAARAALDRIAPAGTRVAVHIRLGDYQNWTVLGKQGVALPLDYYRQAMQSIAARVPDPVFVVFTDSPELLGNLAAQLGMPLLLFHSQSAIIDFAAMALCDHSIVSASTYSWWAAMISYTRSKIVIGPKYWAGFKSKTWFPATMFSERLEYIDIGQE